MGVPIDGTLNQFLNQASKKGLTYVERVDGLDFYFGNYLGYDCVVGAVSLEDKDLVYSVIACVVLRQHHLYIFHINLYLCSRQTHWLCYWTN